jgi:hypothetical protein
MLSKTNEADGLSFFCREPQAEICRMDSGHFVVEHSLNEIAPKTTLFDDARAAN